MNRIGVIGIGRLGLSFALLAERSGYSVLGCDTRDSYVATLNDKSYTTGEPFINEYLTNSKAFMATIDLQAVTLYADILFCFVATPSLPDGSYDHSAVDTVVNELQELHVKGQDMTGKVLVIGCTVMPGYTASIQSKLESTGITVVYNPEFIAQGDIINGLRKADMVLIGTDSEPALHSLTAIYRTIMDNPAPRICAMSPCAAEITKISINCYLTMKIAYRNMIGEIAINSGVESEVNTIIGAIGADSRIGTQYLLYYGFGYGGVCLPRDMRALGVHTNRVGVYQELTSTIDELNNNHHKYLFNYYVKRNWNRDIPFLFTQLSYKKGVDILTESQQYKLCKDLLEHGYSVDITESDAVIEQVKQELSRYGNKVTYGQVTNGYKIDIYDRR